jgi:hypothetical protein
MTIRTGLSPKYPVLPLSTPRKKWNVDHFLGQVNVNGTGRPYGIIEVTR